MNHSVAILSSSSFALFEIANVLFNNSFHVLATFPYSQLLIVLAYLSGASVTVSPEWQIIQKITSTCLALYLYLNNQLEILSGSRWGINISI